MKGRNRINKNRLSDRSKMNKGSSNRIRKLSSKSRNATL